MVLASQPKRRSSLHHKKRTGQHQKQTKHYLKTYWPYLPMLGAGLAVNVLLDVVLAGSSLRTTASVLEEPTRLQFWTNNNGAWLTFLVLGAMVVILGVVFTKHAKAWQRVIVKGEQFFVKHHWLDVILIGTVIAGFIVTRPLS